LSSVALSQNPLIPLISKAIKNPPNSADHFSEIATLFSVAKARVEDRKARETHIPRASLISGKDAPDDGTKLQPEQCKFAKYAP
jgi:hypothetical protein